jgi:hypothetical protein
METEHGFYEVETEFINIVTCITIASQRVGRNIPATHEHATIEGHLFLCKARLNIHP